jgi:hypothetical protein
VAEIMNLIVEHSHQIDARFLGCATGGTDKMGMGMTAR